MNLLDSLSRFRIRLPRDEEARLARAMRRGDLAARNALIESQLPLIVQLAKPFVRPHVPLEDLCQVGVLALIRCLQEFRPRKGRLSTFMYRPVHWAIHYHYMRQRSLLSRPANRPAPHLSPAWERALETCSLEALDEPVRRRVLAIAGESPDAAEERRQQSERLVALRRAVGLLPDRLAHVLRGRLAGRTLADIAGDLDVTKEMVRQYQLKALALVRKELGRA